MTTLSISTASVLLQRLLRQGLHVDAVSSDTLQVWPANALDEDTRAAIAHHKFALIALLTGAADATSDDERRCCRDCFHLQAKGNCYMAWQGRLPDTPRWFTPVQDVQWRCHLFCAWPH